MQIVMGALARLIPRMTDSRAALRTWINALIHTRGMSASALAEAAGLTATTLTRFLNDETYTFDLSRRTIEKLELAYGARSPATSQLGDRDAAGFVHKQGADVGNTGVSAPRPTGMIPDNALDLQGLRKGDIYEIDVKTQPVAGDLVQAEINTNLHRREKVVRIYSPPYLLAHSTDVNLNRPLLIEPGRVSVTGLLTRVTRQLRVVN